MQAPQACPVDEGRCELTNALSLVQAWLAARDGGHRSADFAYSILGLLDIPAGACGVWSGAVWRHWGSSRRSKGRSQNC